MERTVLVRLQAAVGNYVASLRQAAAATKQLRGEVADTARLSKADMDQVGRVMTVAGGVTVGAFALAGKAAIGFESSFAGVRKTVDASEPEFARLASGMRDMARSIPTNVNELNAIGEAAGQLGIATPNLLGFTRTMADLGETTNLSADQAATSLARLANITQMPQTEFDRLGSTIVALGNNFATTESEIVDMATRVAGAGAQIGLTEPQILSVSAALSSLGINAEAGGTAISKVMIDIASEVENGGDKLAVFARVAGMSAGEFADAWRTDAAAALGAFVTGLSDTEQAGGSTLQVLEELEITEVRMRDALLRASGAGELWAEAGDLANDAWSENVALTEEAAQRYQTVEARLQIARNAIADAGITLGEVFTPAVGAAADVTAGLAGMVADLPGPAATAITAVGGLAGAASLTAGGFLLAAPRIVETKKALDTLATSMPKTVSGLRSVGSFLTGPWGIALGAGVFALGAFAKAQADADREAEAFASTLDEQTAAITENTEAHVRNKLQSGDLADDLRRMGIDVNLATDALLGNAAAASELDTALIAVIRSGGPMGALAQQVRDEVNGLSSAFEQGATAARAQAEEIARSKGLYADLQHALDSGLTPQEAAARILWDVSDAAGSAAGNADALGGELPGVAGGFEDVGEEAETASDRIEGFNDSMRALFDPIFGAADALQEVADAKARVAEIKAAKVGEGEEFADQAEKAAALKEALDDQVRAAVDADGAMRTLRAAMEDGTVTTDEAVRMLEGWIAQGWLSREAADAFLAKMGDLHGELDDMTSRTWDLKIQADITGAMADIQRLAAHLTQVTGIKYVHVQGSHSTVVPKGVARDDFHAGGWVGRAGMGPGDVPAKLQWGEFVMNRTDAAAFDAAGILPSDGRTATDVITQIRDGGAAAAGAPQVHVAGPTGGSGTTRSIKVDKGAVQVVAADSRRAGAEAAWQVDRLVREMS